MHCSNHAKNGSSNCAHTCICDMLHVHTLCSSHLPTHLRTQTHMHTCEQPEAYLAQSDHTCAHADLLLFQVVVSQPWVAWPPGAAIRLGHNAVLLALQRFPARTAPYPAHAHIMSRMLRHVQNAHVHALHAHFNMQSQQACLDMLLELGWGGGHSWGHHVCAAHW